jgi:hypothetical protein
MPYIAGIVHVAMAVFFAIHAVRSGRPSWWLFVLLSFPLLGSAVYFFAEFLPDQRHSRGGHRAMRAVRQLLDPEAELRESQLAFDRTPSVQNRSRLADALLNKERAEEALSHFRACVQGPYANDRAMLFGLARAELEVGDANEARRVLEALFASHPDTRTPEAELVQARILARLRDPQATTLFESAAKRLDSMEAYCRLAMHLVETGNGPSARGYFEKVAEIARVSPEHAKVLNKPWIETAKAALKARGSL